MHPEIMYLHIPSFEAEIQNLSDDEVGAYIKLFSLCWKQKDGSATPEQYRELIGLDLGVHTPDNFDNVFHALFKVSDDGRMSPKSGAFTAAMRARNPVAPKPETSNPPPISDVAQPVDGGVSGPNLAMRLISSAKVKAPSEQPMFWFRLEHNADAESLLNDVGMTEDEAIDILRQSAPQPNLRRLSDLRPILEQGRAK